jgi:hypothetical protein
MGQQLVVPKGIPVLLCVGLGAPVARRPVCRLQLLLIAYRIAYRIATSFSSTGGVPTLIVTLRFKPKTPITLCVLSALCVFAVRPSSSDKLGVVLGIDGVLGGSVFISWRLGGFLRLDCIKTKVRDVSCLHMVEVQPCGSAIVLSLPSEKSHSV